MKKNNEVSLKDAIDQMLDTYRIRDRINEVRIKNIWEELMGNAVAKRTSGISIHGDELILRITSAPLKTELEYQKDKILLEMNRLLGGNYIKTVRIQ